MKKLLNPLALVLLIIITSSFVSYNYNQSDGFPPIQKYLDRVSRINDSGESYNFIQKIGKKTFKLDAKSNSLKETRVYKNIDWDFLRFETRAFPNDKNTVECEVFFYNKVDFNGVEDYGEGDIEKTNEKVSSIKFLILKIDEVEFSKVMKDWKESVE